ncbi:MAG TPA: replication-relaxation family protein [Candidatus Saccharimonadia bacterium]|nr:replication-relaxation family protein [Candidatus Saccharimonadia bacterium]
MKTLPHITNKQQTLIRLLYRYRFLERKQLQALLHHTDKRRVSAWLKDLREKQYIKWIYQADDPIESTKPAIYYLGINGIRLLNAADEYPSEELRKRYTESSRKRAFIERCLLLADCCLNVASQSVRNVRFSSVLRAEYINPDNNYHFLNGLNPHACFVKRVSTEDDITTTNYLFEVFDGTSPRYQLRKRIKDYVTYIDDGEWETETGDDQPPIIQLAFATKTDLIYAKRRVRRELADLYDEDIPEDVRILFATIEQIKKQGVTGRVWERV